MIFARKDNGPVSTGWRRFLPCALCGPHIAGFTVALAISIQGVFAQSTSIDPVITQSIAPQTPAVGQCAGKLGVSRTINVSNKHALLVGVGQSGRIGLKPKELVLTFDDGPRAGTTEKVLQALADECLKATFFSLGRSADQHPALLRRIAREGHTIATHTHNHPLLTKRTEGGVRAEISGGVKSIDAALKGSGYQASNFFRYPFLDRSKKTDAIVRELDLVAFHMNIDSWDWRKQTAQQMVALTMSRVRHEGGGVVLFHDIQDKTAEGLPEFLKMIKEEGYTIVHVVPGPDDYDQKEELISQAKPEKPVAISADDALANDSALAAQKEKTERQARAQSAESAPSPQKKPQILSVSGSVSGNQPVKTTSRSAILTHRSTLPQLPAPIDQLRLTQSNNDTARETPTLLQIAPPTVTAVKGDAETGTSGDIEGEAPTEEKKRAGFFKRLFGRGS